MKNVFITGASGFLGNYLLKFASADVHILAQYHTTAPAITSSNIDCLQMDYANPDWTQVQHFQPDTIIHCGAMTQIDKCEQRPAAAVTANLTFTKYLCDVANLTGARFIFISTDQVYDGENRDYTETDAANPVNQYGKIKLATETFVLGNHPNAVVARSALIYGKSLHGKVTFTESMIGRLREGQTVNVFEDEFRTPILVDNLAEAIWELAGNTFTGLLNLGGSQRITRLEMGKIICDMFGFNENRLLPTKMADIHLPAKRPQDLSFDIALAKQVLTTPLTDVSTGLRRAFSQS